ncbi:hypothetical protein [uncultured Dokdonia sp.]|uniref:hypothetical protein n=1 Tax=uncultured Dokdonia sp. TaxID=575653 RepID=UPI00260860B4|nr:hypothetical protein [uncultured Dokdonia sp.]
MKTLDCMTRYLYQILVLGGIFLFIIGCKSEARSSLECPGGCEGKCTYTASLSGDKDPNACGGNGGYSIVKVLIGKKDQSALA